MRSDAERSFLIEAGWGEAQIAPLAGDASTRSYRRLRLGDRRAVLMDAPPSAETAPCPPGASVEERRRLGYNALARLAGAKLDAFVCIDSELRAAGLSAPEVYAADPETGFALLEDLGDALFSRAIPAGADEASLYGAAVDALAAIHGRRPPIEIICNGAKHRLLDYDEAALTAEIELLPEWYWPHAVGTPASADAKAEFLAAWSAPLASLVGGAGALVLRDYHADNLIWLPDRSGPARAGLLDFQDAVIGHPAYDLVSLLQDVRREVSPALEAAMLARYVAARRERDAMFDEDAFRAAYAVLGAQRNTKIVGIFARLANRDGKRAYLDYMPRARALLTANLSHPALAPVRGWIDRNAPEALEL
ncbi:MAG: phosphotransferase [Pseudomonadota bacterium]